jgi:hypothetical protein
MKPKSDAARHKYAIMIDSHRQTWVTFCKAAFDKPYKEDMAEIRRIFRVTTTPEEASKRIKSFLKGPAYAGWKTALTTAWVETGKATLEYIHAFHTGKSAYESDTYTSWRDFDDEGLVLIKDVAALQSTWAQFVANKLKKGGQKITGITDTTRDQVMKVIADGVENGDGHYVIGQAVDDALGDSWLGRGMMISRTEANSAMNAAISADAKATVPDMWKTWSTTGMDNVREWHQDADGQSVAQSDTFTVMGEDLDYPGDDAGSPENIINCACTILLDPAPAESEVPGEESSEEVEE